MHVKKIPAFTLMEVTIAMLLTSLVIGITYTAYRLVSRSYVDYVHKQEIMATFLTADKLLKQDFSQARRIIRSGENVEHSTDADDRGGLQIETDAGIIRYVFTPGYLLRDQFALRVDTFKITIKAPVFFFENVPAENGTLIDQVHFETRLEGAPLTLNYKKTYSAQDLFE